MFEFDFAGRATPVNLQSVFKCLAAQWPRLEMSALEEYKVRTVGDGCDDDEEDTDVLNKPCKDCPVGCYQILKRYNIFTDAYHILGWGYKFLLTLPVTHVACERSFSVLKHIKSQRDSQRDSSMMRPSFLCERSK